MFLSNVFLRMSTVAIATAIMIAMTPTAMYINRSLVVAAPVGVAAVGCVVATSLA